MNRLLRTCQANLKPGPLHEPDSKQDAAPLKPKSQTSGAPHRGPHEQVIVRGVESSPGFGLSGEQEHPSPTDVIPTEATEGSEAEGPAVSPSSDNAGAPFKRSLSGEQEQPSPTNVTPIEAPIFDIQTIDYKKYDPRFKELERLHSTDPDYIDHLRAAIRQIQEEEEQAWRAAGCPPLTAER